MKDILTKSLSYHDMLSMIKDGKRFSFSRYGDGELQAIFRSRKATQNCDSHQYFPDMGQRLLGILKSSPDYYLGLQSLGYKQNKESIDELTRKYDIKWCESNILHRASIKGRLQELFDVLNDKNVLIVGAKHLVKLYPKYLSNPYFIQVPDKDCWLEYEKTYEELKAMLKIKEWVVLFCASMMSNVLIDDFDGQGTLIDAGSVFDVYCGVKSRQYMKNMEI